MFKEINDWLWKKANRKPPKPSKTYLVLVIPWVVCGVMLGALLQVMLGLFNIKEVEPMVWLGMGVFTALFIVGLVLISIIIIRNHKTEGYYDAIARAGMDYWEKEARRLGMIKEGGEHTEHT